MIAAKTWREIRLMTVLYIVLLESLLILAIVMWPNLRDETERLASLKILLPADFMRRWLDGVMGEAPYPAYMAIQMYFKGINIIGIACACLFGTGIIARERENQTLEILLSRPASRSRILFSKFAVLATAIIAPIFVTSWTALPLSWMIDEDLPFGRVTLAAGYAASFAVLFLAMSTAFSVRMRTQVHVAFVVGAFIVFQICLYFIPDIRVASLFRVSDYDVYWPLLAANWGAASQHAQKAWWILLATLFLYGIADLLFRRARL